MLLIAIGFSITLDSNRNINRISSILRSINEDNYYKLIFTRDGRSLVERVYNITPSNTSANRSIERMMDIVFDDTAKTTTFFSIVLNAARWDQYNGVLTHNNVLSTAITNVNPAYSANMNEAHNLFASFISDEVVHILESYSNIMEPAVSSSSALISQYLDDVVGNINFDRLGRIVLDNIQENVRHMESSKSVSNVIDMLSKSCGSLNKVNVDNTIQDLWKYNIPTMFRSYNDIVNFHNHVERVGSTLHSISDGLIASLDNVLLGSARNDLRNAFRQTYNYIQHRTNDLFNTEDPRFGKLLEEPDVNHHVRWAAVNNIDRIMDIRQDEFQTLVQIADEASISITNIIYFFLVYTVISYICKSIDIIKLEFETVRRNATDFPNYCLVLPKALIDGLYAVIHVQNFKRVMDDPSAIQNIQQQYENWSPNEMQSKRIVDFIVNRLLVPNIILIDEKKSELYYRFMFMEKCEKIRLNTVSTYIKNQHDILVVR